MKICRLLIIADRFRLTGIKLLMSSMEKNEKLKFKFKSDLPKHSIRSRYFYSWAGPGFVIEKNQFKSLIAT